MRVLLAAWAVAMVLAVSASAGRPSGLAVCRWRPVLDAAGPALTGIAALAGDNVWAVGNDGLRAAFLHRAGRRWQTIASPVFALDIAAVSASDIWAVGSSAPGPAAAARAAWWNGRRWKVLPLKGRSGEYLRSVAALSASDVWAVGADARGGPLIARWNGRAWKRFGGEAAHGLLHAIKAPSPRTVWAVGTQGMQTLGPADEHPLVERWTGSGWQPLAAPKLDWVNVNLLAVDVVSPREAYAVGSVDLDGGLPLVLRFNHGGWSALSTAGLPATDVSLTAVAAFGPSDLWLVGAHGFGQSERPLLAHWNGQRWNRPTTRPLRGGLTALAALSATDMWAAGGSLQANGTSHSLLEHYSCR